MEGECFLSLLNDIHSILSESLLHTWPWLAHCIEIITAFGCGILLKTKKRQASNYISFFLK